VQPPRNIPELIQYTSHRLLMGQLIGGGIGAVLFAVVGAFRGRDETPPPIAQ
jgi:hypothetical protein